MKKLLFMAMLFIGAMNAKADDQITGSLKVEAGNQSATLAVSLTNSITYVAFQMDVTLPAGWTVESAAPAASARLINGGTVNLSAVGGSANESTDFNLVYNVIGGNKLRVLAYNLKNTPISANAGELFTVKLTKSGSAAAAATDWVATFSEVQFVTESMLKEVAMTVSNAGNKVTGETGALMGDVNHDGKVNALDLAKVVNYILGKAKSTDLDLTLADMDGSTKVNAIDLAKIVNIFLAK